MCISEGGISDKQSFLLSNPREKASAPMARNRWREPSAMGLFVPVFRRIRLPRKFGIRRALHSGKAVDGNFRRVGQELGCPILPFGELEQLWALVDEAGGASPLEKRRVGHHVEQERNVRLHSTDAIFLQSAFHAQGSILEAPPISRNFYK